MHIDQPTIWLMSVWECSSYCESKTNYLTLSRSQQIINGCSFCVWSSREISMAICLICAKISLFVFTTIYFSIIFFAPDIRPCEINFNEIPSKQSTWWKISKVEKVNVANDNDKALECDPNHWVKCSEHFHAFLYSIIQQFRFRNTTSWCVNYDRSLLKFVIYWNKWMIDNLSWFSVKSESVAVSKQFIIYS